LRKLILLIIIFGLNQQDAWSQLTDVVLRNPSFEGSPTQGIISDFGIHTRLPEGWRDCGIYKFPDETPPDIHPDNLWGNTLEPNHGRTYLGMVVRVNETWESVSQRLNELLRKDVCYDFSVDLARSDNYWSKLDQEDLYESNFKTPTVLRIWGGTAFCDKEQLLAESKAINHDSWKTYDFTIKPKTNFRYITLEAFYKTPTLEPYNGHVLVDNITIFRAYQCTEEPPILAEVTQKQEKKVTPKPKKKTPPHKQRSVKKPEVVAENDIIEEPRKKVMTELARDKIKVGKPIKIKNLYFKADSSAIETDSYDVLNEIFYFLRTNEDITVEIGGHTNTKPPKEYCDSLSTARAKEVATYLIRKGIEKERIVYRGYGKDRPLINSKSSMANRRNQRVEIKILSMG